MGRTLCDAEEREKRSRADDSQQQLKSRAATAARKTPADGNSLMSPLCRGGAAENIFLIVNH